MGSYRALERWTPEEVAKFIELRDAGKKRREIAAELGRTLGSIKARLRTEEGYRRPTRTPRPSKGPKRLPTGIPPYLIPARRENNDGKHLALIAAASPGGFPFYDLKAQFRVAA